MCLCLCVSLHKCTCPVSYLCVCACVHVHVCMYVCMYVLMFCESICIYSTWLKAHLLLYMLRNMPVFSGNQNTWVAGKQVSVFSKFVQLYNSLFNLLLVTYHTVTKGCQRRVSHKLVAEYTQWSCLSCSGIHSCTYDIVCGECVYKHCLEWVGYTWEQV